MVAFLVWAGVRGADGDGDRLDCWSLGEDEREGEEDNAMVAAWLGVMSLSVMMVRCYQVRLVSYDRWASRGMPYELTEYKN